MQTEWLLIDGYSLLYRDPSQFGKDLHRSRMKLIRRLEALAGYFADRATVVFDGRSPAPEPDFHSATLEIVFSPGDKTADTVIERSVDVRYRSQTHELITPAPDGAVDAALVRGIVERFEASYEDTYGRGAGFREAGIELTTFRVSGIGRTPKPSFRDTAPTTATSMTSIWTRIRPSAVSGFPTSAGCCATTRAAPRISKTPRTCWPIRW